MNYYDLIDLIKDEMAKQGMTKTKLCELTYTNIRTMNAYLYKEHCMPLEKLMCILKSLASDLRLWMQVKKGRERYEL